MRNIKYRKCNDFSNSGPCDGSFLYFRSEGVALKSDKKELINRTYGFFLVLVKNSIVFIEAVYEPKSLIINMSIVFDSI